MAITLDWMQLAALAGALQGLLLSGVLFVQRHNRTANRLLAALMVAFTLYLAAEVYHGAGLMRRYPHYFGVGYQMPLVFGPLVYLYAVAASDRSWRCDRRALVHFAPVAISVMLAGPIYLMSGPDKVAAYERFVRGDFPMWMRIGNPLKYVSGLAYTTATVVHLRRHRRQIEDSYSDTARVNLRWLLWLTGAAAGIWIIATTLAITDFGHRLRDEHVALGIALVVYAIGYMGLRQPEVFRYETAELPVPPELNLSTALPAEALAPTAAELRRYEHSGLDEHEAERLRQALLRLMDEQSPWKDSGLTLADLAARLNSTPHKLSEVLNARVGQTFYEFVNAYRVRDVQRRIRAGEARTRKMFALAQDAGFASKSTFNEAFKKYTSQTPSDFRQATGA